MTFIEPMPQEIALAHAGRIEFLFPSELSILESKARSANEPKLVTLAKACGMTPEQYASSHSLMPFFRMVARGAQPATHGQLGQETLTRRLGTATSGKVARICPQCVNDDLNHWHFTWYRRMHQLPGIDWCSVHRCQLVTVDNPNPWTVPPHQWIDQKQIRPLQVAPQVIEEDGFLGRLVEISCELLQRPHPLPVGRVGGALTEQLQQMGFRVCLHGAKPLLSDLVREKAPETWLRRHWPGLEKKQKGEVHHGLDRIVNRTAPATGLAYVTALAAMFESASEALNFFSSATPKNARKPNPGSSGSEVRPSSFWEGELWEIYENYEGNIMEIARHLKMERTYLALKLQKYGKPSLKDCHKDPRWLALLRFQAGASLNTACQQENVLIDSVEALLRRTDPRVIGLVRNIVQRNGRGAATSITNSPGNEAIEIPSHFKQSGVSQSRYSSSKPELVNQLTEEVASAL